MRFKSDVLVWIVVSVWDSVLKILYNPKYQINYQNYPMN